MRGMGGYLLTQSGWLDPESFNHSLSEILYEQEGYARLAHGVDPGVWGFLPFLPPDETSEKLGNGTLKTGKSRLPTEKALPPAPVFPRKFGWPLPPAQDGLSTTMFLIAPENVQKLRQEVIADPEAKGAIASTSDIVQAFFWSFTIKARYRVATHLRGETFGPDEISVLELPVDGRLLRFCDPCPTIAGSLPPVWVSRECTP